jgi:acetylornithine/N-succinyldiaminopimelate aminotransferase
MTDLQADLTAAQILALQTEHLVQTYARPSLVLARGQGVWAYDLNDAAYLDFTSGIAVNALGHADPGLAAALASQAAKLIHTSNLYHTIPQAQLADQLAENSFADRVFFTNSGTEANEAAIKFARKYQKANGHEGKTQLVCFDHAFHGRTMGSLALTPKPQYQDAFKPLMGDAVVAPFNDLAAIPEYVTERTCAVFIEPIQGEGGIHAATPEFLVALRARCDVVGALLVFDEIQCGMGRTGDLWAHTASGVQPDMMTVAKPLAGGLPIGAALVTQRVADSIQAGDHGSTFAGGPLITAAGGYVFNRINQPTFLAHVQTVGAYLKERLEEISSPHIVEVRGRGLMIGVEFNMPVEQIVKKGYEHGLLMVGAGPNVLRVIPPLIVSQAECDIFITRLTAILAEVGA